MSAPEAAIRLEGVSKTFPGSSRPAVGSLDLTIPVGQITVLVGPSGCGKTTTLKMINRLIEPTGGRLEVLGTEIRDLPAHELRRQIGYVIQQIGLFPHKTIAENIATVPKLLGWDKARTRQRVDELTELVGLDPEHLKRYPAALSGGQQQRVGVARALAADPPILLMDEPYSAVDPIVRGRLQDELLALQSEVQKTIVLVTHDIDEAIKLGDQIAILNVGGVLEQVGPPEELLRAPANDFVAGFLGQERGLKRLGLLMVGDAELVPGPVVAPEAMAEDARRVMAENGVDWVGVVDHDRLLGWVSAESLNGSNVGGADLRPFAATVTPDAALREALDVIVGAQTRVAVVQDDDERYLGMLTIDQIAGGLEGGTGVILAADKDSFIWWDWVWDHTDEIKAATIEHLQLTAIALVVGLVLSIALATIAIRWQKAYAPIAGFAGVLYAIPSLALFAILFPITGLTVLTAEIALVGYTLLILIRNIVAGVQGVPDAVKEAADGMGYRPLHRFFAVDLRLATPAIVAGIRIAAVTIIGLVTVTFVIGFGGYGSLINDGLSRDFNTPVVVGAILSIALALAIDVVLLLVERLLTPWNRTVRR